MTVRSTLAIMFCAALAAAFVPAIRAERAGGAKPPAQPETGPGGGPYPSASVRASSYGEGALAYWIFEPADPAPATAPVVVFAHGWGGLDPNAYGAWIEHVVRRGNVVIYPLYQADLRTPTTDFTPNAISAVRAALGTLAAGGHVRPDLERFAIVGHSAGGLVAANTAALAAESGLPVPRAVMAVCPGKTWNLARRTAIPLADLSKIPSSTLLLSITADADRVVEDVDAKRVFAESTAVPASNKDYVVVPSDDHGRPALRADHLSPCAASPVAGAAKGRGGSMTAVDALDYYAYWKLFDALTDAAFFGKNREVALGNTEQQRSMGVWSDGVPVKELVVTDAP